MKVKDEAKGMSVTAQNAMLELATKYKPSIRIVETGSSYKELTKQHEQQVVSPGEEGKKDGWK